MGKINKSHKDPENAGRRKAVKKIVGGVTALAAYNMLPVSWEKPIIEQVFLPAHAQTSGENAIVSVPESLSVQALSIAGGDDYDGIEICFDGADSLTMMEGDDASSSDDLLLFFDADSSDSGVFDVEEGPASNWKMISNSFPSDPYVSDVPDGSHEIRVERLKGLTSGTIYDVLFDVKVADISGGVKMKVSNLRAVAVV